MANKTANNNKGLGLANPLVQENWSGYGQAVVHLAWIQDGDQVRHLLFGMVELRPCEFPIIVSSDEQIFRSDAMPWSRLHYRRFAIPATDAIGWYQNSMAGDVRLPTAQKDNPEGGGVLLYGGPFVCWPAWPILAASNELDFAPDWVQGSRAHFLHPRTELPAGALVAVRCERNRRQLENWLHFDLVDLYSDYLGAISLVAPNPLFRSVEKSHLDSPTDGSAETVAYKIIARAGQDVGGTRLEVMNESLRGRLQPAAAEFADDPVRVLEFATPISKEGRIVTHPRYGLLAWNEPVPLISTIHLGLNAVARRKKVEVPSGGKKKPTYKFSVCELEDGGDMVIGRIDDEGMEASAVAAAHRRARKLTEDAEHWFQDAPKDATRFIRDAIGKARHRVFIADPYFAGRELFAFGHAIRRPDVELRVLTSTLALKSKPGKDTGCPMFLGARRLLRAMARPLQAVESRIGAAGPENRRTPIDPATLVVQAIASFQSYPAEPIVRVLKGKRPCLHDRFLVVDDTAWFSGTSLNSIGERASMIVRLSHPEVVVARLEGMWATATPFAKWMAGSPRDG